MLAALTLRLCDLRGLDPQRKAEVLAINGLLNKGRELAKQGELEQAAGLFAKVKGLSKTSISSRGKKRKQYTMKPKQ